MLSQSVVETVNNFVDLVLNHRVHIGVLHDVQQLLEQNCNISQLRYVAI
jgi:hypothetical protein